MNRDKRELMPGLYLVSTPIGNARDITLRALDILAGADMLAAEDTRSLRRLMEIHGLSPGDRPLVAYHDHSGDRTRARLVSAAASGAAVAYASEAGTPMISDPGYDLVRAALAAEVPVTVAPGPAAAIAALTLSGLPTDRFFFAGFLPNSRAARRRALAALAETQATLVFYESPKRLAAMLADAAEIFGPDRLAAVSREITKKFEETRRGPLGTLARNLAAEPVKGEVVVMVAKGDGAVNEALIESSLNEALETMSVRDASDYVAKMYNTPRRPLYQRAMELTGRK